ncbi:hypothetical protein BC826DRAFT_1056581 [Russula brevipes]|nr:hypothetical protein BC826DRAFT_1056581 [Russula brevipes]
MVHAQVSLCWSESILHDFLHYSPGARQISIPSGRGAPVCLRQCMSHHGSPRTSKTADRPCARSLPSGRAKPVMQWPVQPSRPEAHFLGSCFVKCL